MAIKVGSLSVSYDDSSDVLYLSVGEPRAAVTQEDDEGVLIRKDPVTEELVGVTILAYGSHFRHLPDLSWLANRGLPSDVVHFLNDRPVL
jgi:uncharacterized protein YuzE